MQETPQPVIELRGEVDATDAADFERELTALAASGPLILDLSHAEYIDSAGFEVLDRFLATGALILVIAATSVLRRAAVLMNVPFNATVEEARGELAGGR